MLYFKSYIKLYYFKLYNVKILIQYIIKNILLYIFIKIVK